LQFARGILIGLYYSKHTVMNNNKANAPKSRQQNSKTKQSGDLQEVINSGNQKLPNSNDLQQNNNDSSTDDERQRRGSRVK